MLRLSNISKSYDNTLALAPLSHEMTPGAITVLIGPSGCGKSTLLRLMNGLIQPTSGTVYFDDEPLTRKNALTIRHRMGYVIQDGGLFPHLTARENVTLLAKQLGWAQDKMETQLRDLAGLVQIPSDRLSSYPLQLSRGQQQRVSLMRALMLDPDVLLLDEPLGALDPMIRADLQTDLRRIFRELNKTVVMVTHDLHEAGYFADTILLLREGVVEQQGPFAELLNQPASSFVEAFINAQRTIFDG